MNSLAKVVDFGEEVKRLKRVELYDSSLAPVDTSLLEAFELIGKHLGIKDEYSGNHAHINVNNQYQEKFNALNRQVNYMNLRLKQAVPIWSVIFVIINFGLFSSGFTMWYVYKLTGFCLINPITLFFINFGTLGLAITGLTSMWEWRVNNDKGQREKYNNNSN